MKRPYIFLVLAVLVGFTLTGCSKVSIAKINPKSVVKTIKSVNPMKVLKTVKKINPKGILKSLISPKTSKTVMVSGKF